MATSPITFSPSDIDQNAGSHPATQGQVHTVPGAASITINPSDIDHNAPPVVNHVPSHLANDPKFQAMSPAEQQEVIDRHARANEGKNLTSPPSQGWGSTYADLGEGIAKGATETIEGIGRGARALGAAAVSATNPQLSYAEAKKALTPNFISNDKGTGLFDALDTEAANTTEKVGKVAEGVFEFIAGDEALKGLGMIEKANLATKLTKMAQESPYIAKALNIGLNAVRTGTVGATQEYAKTGDAGKALTTGAITGAFSAGGEMLSEGASAAASKLADYVKKFDPVVWHELGLPVIQKSAETVQEVSPIVDASGNTITKTVVKTPAVVTPGGPTTTTIPAEKTAAPISQLIKKYTPGAVASAIIAYAPIPLSAKIGLLSFIGGAYGIKAGDDVKALKEIGSHPVIAKAAENVAKAVTKFSNAAPAVGAVGSEQVQK